MQSISEIEISPAARHRRPAAADVARAAGVSVATVSRVLRGEQRYIRAHTRQRVLETAAALGYRPNLLAASMRTGRTRMMTLIIPDITNPFWPEVARGVQDRAAEAGYGVVLANTDWNATRERSFATFAERSRMDGLIVSPCGPVEPLLALGLPTVVLGSRADPVGCDVVTSDTYGAMRLATRHLLERGHRRIAFLGGLNASRSGRTRQAGYRDELTQWGAPVDTQLILEAPYTIAGGRGATDALLERTDAPTAIVGANDVLAIGALLAAHDRGWVVPESLSVVGTDDIALAAATWPGLTTVAKPKYDMGRAAVELLLERVEGSAAIGDGRRRVLPVTLVERGSVAGPRKERG